MTRGIALHKMIRQLTMGLGGEVCLDHAAPTIERDRTSTCSASTRPPAPWFKNLTT